MHQSTRLAGQLHPGNLTEAKSAHITVKALRSQHAGRQGCGAHIERRSQQPLQILYPMRPAIPVLRGHAAVLNRAPILISPTRVHQPGIKRRSHRDQLEHGSWFIHLADRRVLKERRLIDGSVISKARRLITGSACHRQNFPRLGIQHQNRPRLGFVLHQRLVQFAFDIRLDGAIQSQAQIGARIGNAQSCSHLLRQRFIANARDLANAANGLTAEQAQQISLHPVAEAILIHKTQRV